MNTPKPAAAKSAYPAEPARPSRTLDVSGNENSAPCRGSFAAYDGQGRGRGLCFDCELDAGVHEFDLPQDDA